MTLTISNGFKKCQILALLVNKVIRIMSKKSVP